MPTWLRRLTPLLFALACAGCLDFEQETLVLKVSPDGKTAQCLLIYEGLHVSGAEDGDLSRARQDLTDLARPNGSFYLLTNAFAVNLNADPKGEPAQELRKGRLRKLLAVKNGAFFRHGARQEQFGYWQTLSTADLPALLKEVNAVAAEHLADLAKEERERRKEECEKPKRSEATLRMWENAPAAQPKIVQWTGKQIEILIPATAEDGRELGKELLQDVTAAGKKMLVDNGFQINAAASGLRIIIGPRGGKPGPIHLRLHEPSAEGQKRETNPGLNARLQDHAKSLPAAFKSGVTAEKLVAEFISGK